MKALYHHLQRSTLLGQSPRFMTPLSLDRTLHSGSQCQSLVRSLPLCTHFRMKTSCRRTLYFSQSQGFMSMRIRYTSFRVKAVITCLHLSQNIPYRHCHFTLFLKPKPSIVIITIHFFRDQSLIPTQCTLLLLSTFFGRTLHFYQSQGLAHTLHLIGVKALCRLTLKLYLSQSLAHTSTYLSEPKP